jgi:hypothetical protein
LPSNFPIFFDTLDEDDLEEEREDEELTGGIISFCSIKIGDYIYMRKRGFSPNSILCFVFVRPATRLLSAFLSVGVELVSQV